MSDFYPGNDAINALVSFADQHLLLVSGWSTQRWAEELATEAIKSVNHRHNRTDEIPSIQYRRDDWFLNLPDVAVRVIKMVNYYTYFACDHPGWNDSQARHLMDAITGAALCMLPGYEEAPWGYERPKV